MDIIGCLLGGGGGYLEVIVWSEASSGYLAEADIEVPGAEVLEALTWVILSLSPWLLANSLMVSMMETVCTWPLPPFIMNWDLNF